MILNLNFVSIKLGLIKYKRNEDKKNMDSDFKFKFLFEIEFEFCSIYELKCAKFWIQVCKTVQPKYLSLGTGLIRLLNHTENSLFESEIYCEVVL